MSRIDGPISPPDASDFIRYAECTALIDEGERSERECTFAGLIDGWAYNAWTDTWYWTCPLCGYEHEERER